MARGFAGVDSAGRASGGGKAIRIGGKGGTGGKGGKGGRGVAKLQGGQGVSPGRLSTLVAPLPPLPPLPPVPPTFPCPHQLTVVRCTSSFCSTLTAPFSFPPAPGGAP